MGVRMLPANAGNRMFEKLLSRVDIVARRKMTPTNPHQEYVRSRVAAATPAELTRMLHEALGLIQTLLEGWIGAMHNLEASNPAVSKDGDPTSVSGPSTPHSSPYSSTTTQDKEAPNRSWQC